MRTLLEIVTDYRKKGMLISDEDIYRAYQIASRKVEICKKDKDYMPLIFKDEIKNLITRKSINEKSKEMRILEHV